ncbi:MULTISPECIES: hypothetical protein [unclassified Streptomyces]|uniref:hypothetical protein n=1 Tax=unclassified Streptomyces TaxID=2593676 RepID=UPI00278C67E0|nr:MULTISPECIES: hypothetical protein [unclassified Streptomyces]
MPFSTPLSMPRSRALTVALTAAAAAASLLTGAGAAHADADVPYSQAAAQVNASGSIAKKTATVVAVQRVATGKYCIEVDPTIDVAESMPMATLQERANWGSEIYVTRSGSGCPNPANSVRVITGRNGAASNQPFHVVIP